MALNEFQVMSFDCYGTLIDWEKGILEALKPLTGKASRPVADGETLEAYADAESAEEARQPEAPYPLILRAVYAALSERWGVPVDEEEGQRFSASIPVWPPFPDSAEALDYLKQHYKLVILSNVDRKSFLGTAASLGVEFDAIYTAEEIGSYKPDPDNFQYLIDHVKSDFGLDRSSILHVAQSLYHDHEPAKAAGLTTVWIDRRGEQAGWGATRPPAEVPRYDYRFSGMAELVEAHRKESTGG